MMIVNVDDNIYEMIYAYPNVFLAESYTQIDA